MKKLRRDEPCWCGSGKNYGECHADFDRKIETFRKKFHKVPPRSIIKNEYQLEKMRESAKINIAVLGMEVQVSDDQLSKALKCLPERKRNIILLSYFMDMSDAEIGELMNVVRTTVYRHRTSTLEELRKMMEEE